MKRSPCVMILVNVFLLLIHEAILYKCEICSNGVIGWHAFTKSSFYKLTCRPPYDSLK